MSLKVTNIKVNKFERDNLKAFVNITFNEELTIDGFKLMDGPNGLWLASPSIKKKDGWSNIIKLSKELQKDLVDMVTEKLESTDSDSGSSDSSRRRR